MKKLTQLIVCALTSILIVMSAPARAQISFYYAYFVQSDSGQTRVDLLDVGKPSGAISLAPVSKDGLWNGWGVPHSIVPNLTGSSLIVFNGQYGQIKASLVNISNKEISFIAEGPIALTRRGGSIADDFQTYGWSPNSSRFAFSRFVEQGKRLMIFDINTKQTMTADAEMGAHSSTFGRVAWSPHSTRLVTTVENCADPNDLSTCNAALEIWTISQSLERTQSIDVTGLMESASVGSNYCDLAWSPDGRYISFVSLCDPIQLSRAKEVHLWDLQENKISQVTQWTTQAAKQLMIVTAQYQTAWTLDNHLLISVLFTIAPNPPSVALQAQTQTVVYDPAMKTTTPLSPRYMKYLAVNPVTGELAAMEAVSVDGSLWAKDLRVNLGTLAAGKFTTTLETTGGEYAVWSPDGKVLAYSLTDETGTTMTFLDAASKSASSVTLRKSDGVVVVYPIGWVVAN